MLAIVDNRGSKLFHHPWRCSNQVTPICSRRDLACSYQSMDCNPHHLCHRVTGLQREDSIVATTTGRYLVVVLEYLYSEYHSMPPGSVVPFKATALLSNVATGTGRSGVYPIRATLPALKT